MEIKPSKGGARPNAGRPVSKNPAKQRSLRFTDEHWEKLKRLGGAHWIIEKMRSEK